MHVSANKTVCNLRTAVEVWNTILHFISSLPLSHSLTVFLFYGREKCWWMAFQLVGYQKKNWHFSLNAVDAFWFSSIVDCFPQSFFLFLIFSLFFISNGSKHHFTYCSFPESWCQCWKGIWMCLVEGNSVSPFSEPSKLWSTSSSSLSARGCSTLSKFCGSTFKQKVMLLCSFC